MAALPSKAMAIMSAVSFQHFDHHNVNWGASAGYVQPCAFNKLLEPYLQDVVARCLSSHIAAEHVDRGQPGDVRAVQINIHQLRQR